MGAICPSWHWVGEKHLLPNYANNSTDLYNGMYKGKL